MNEILELILKSPVANLLIIAGLMFLGIAVVGNISGKIQPGTEGRLLSGLLGLCLLGGGLAMYQTTPLDNDASLPSESNPVVSVDSRPDQTDLAPPTFTPAPAL